MNNLKDSYSEKKKIKFFSSDSLLYYFHCCDLKKKRNIKKKTLSLSHSVPSVPAYKNETLDNCGIKICEYCVFKGRPLKPFSLTALEEVCGN